MFLLYKVSLFLAQGKDTEAHLPIWSGSANLLASMICHYISYAFFFFLEIPTSSLGAQDLSSMTFSSCF